jgi:hypothetical protein
MGRTPSVRQLYEETISELKMEVQAAWVDLGHKGAFDLLLKEAVLQLILPALCPKNFCLQPRSYSFY